MAIRKKRCVICNELFTPTHTSMQKACSWEHAIEYAKLKEAAKEAQLNKVRNEAIGLEKLSKLMQSTETIVHRFVKERDNGKPCAACGTKFKSNFQASHVFDKKQHNMIRYNLDNIHLCCKGCNIFKDGNYDVYRANLPNIIGQEKYDKLKSRADIALRIPYTFSRHELKEIQEEIKKQRKLLKS